MRAKHAFGALCLILGLAAAAPAQRAVNQSGSYSGQATQNQSLNTSNLSTPLPNLPVQRRFSLGNLIPRWLIPGSKKSSTAGLPGFPAGGQ